MARQVYLITRPDQLKALASAIRHDIVDCLAAQGSLPVRDLAAALGEKPTAIYRHLATLERLGLVRSSSVASARGRPAMVYRTAAPVMRLAHLPKSTANRRLLAKIAAALARNAAREYAAVPQSGSKTEGPKRNHALFERLSSPSPKKLARVNALLEELEAVIAEPDRKPGKSMVRFTWFLSTSSSERKRLNKR